MDAKILPRRSGDKFVGWRPASLLAAVAAVLILVRVLGVGDRLGELRDWILRLGFWGPPVFILLYAGLAAVAFPGEILTVAAGMLFGSVEGVICASIASTLGASLAFLAARYLAREAFDRWLSGNKKFQRLIKLTEKRGALIVAFTRLVPVFPYNLLNYAFGLTRVPFSTYVFWSWLCMLPATVLYVVGTDALVEAVVQREIPWVLMGVVAAVGVFLTFLIRSLRQRL